MKSWIVISYTHGKVDYYLVYAETKQEAESKVGNYVGNLTILHAKEIKEVE